MSAGNTGGGSKGAKRGQGRAPGGGGYAKTGKPRPGTGGYGRAKLEGKGPTPPAEMRPGHPAQRAAARAAKAASSGTSRPRATQPASSGTSRPRATQPASSGTSRPRTTQAAADRGTQRRERRDDLPEMVAGRNPVVESLRAQVPALALYVTARAQEDERVAESVQLAAGAGIAVLETSMVELDRLTDNSVHQGVALRIRPYEYAHPEDLLAPRGKLAPLVVALDGVTDPRNLGAIVRSAAAFGAAGVLVPARRSAHVTAGAWKASAGALSRLPVAQCSNLTRTLETYKRAGLFVAGLDAEGSVDVHDMTIADGPMVLVVGSEGRGLSRIVASACDMLVSIPMSSGMESLNAGIAGSIALYEIASRRKARSGAS